jgi:hypothetical protein
MSENPKLPTFFIRDPFTEEVKGPLTVQQLKQWFAQGAVGDWGVSKSPDGPWSPAAQVKGLASAQATEVAQAKAAIPKQPATTKVASPPDQPISGTACMSSLRARVSTALGWAKKHYPKSLIGRVLVTVGGLWISLLLVCGVPLGIGILWSETLGQGAKARHAMDAAKAQAIRTEAALDEAGKAAHKAMEQLQGDAYKQRVIRDAEYERAKKELGR